MNTNHEGKYHLVECQWYKVLSKSNKRQFLFFHCITPKHDGLLNYPRTLLENAWIGQRNCDETTVDYRENGIKVIWTWTGSSLKTNNDQELAQIGRSTFLPCAVSLDPFKRRPGPPPYESLFAEAEFVVSSDFVIIIITTTSQNLAILRHEARDSILYLQVRRKI